LRVLLQQAWSRLAPRERQGLALALLVVGAAAVWWLALAPALQTLRQAPARHTRLDTQLQALGAMATQARNLQGQPALATDEALRALEAATQRHLGPQGRLTVAGDQATVTLQAVPPDALARWLADVRVNARTTPTETRLQQAPSLAWSGTLALPLRR
jgi:general secretion pathway protein M